MARVTIVGAGNMGRGIGTRAVAGGDQGEIVDRDQAGAPKLARKVVVDITNPVDPQTWEKLATPPGASSAEEVQQLVPQGTPVVKAFNTTFAPTLVDGEVAGQQLDVLIAGDDEAAKQKVAQLVSDGGLRPIDVGPWAA